MLASPADDAVDQELLLTFESGYADSALSILHAEICWQVATDGAFDYKVLEITSPSHKTRLPVPAGVLKINKIYYWRAGHIDTNGVAWRWSEIRSFTTRAIGDDANDKEKLRTYVP